MDPFEFMRRYWDVWLGFARAPARGMGRDMPFPEGEGALPSQPGQPDSRRPEGLEDVAARDFLSVLGRLNNLSEAQAKIVNAWFSIFLNRANGFVSDPQERESGSRQRRHAVDELLDGYVSFSREYVGAWNAFLTNMTGSRQWR